MLLRILSGLFLAVSCSAADPATRDLTIMHVPGKGVSVPRLRARDLRADLAGKPVRVLSVAGRNALERTPVVVVLDFANTSIGNWPCLVAEIAPFANRIGNRSFRVFITGAPRSPFYLADFGSETLPMPLFSAAAADSSRVGCGERKRGEYPYTARRIPLFPGAQPLVHAFARQLDPNEGPYRIIWISEDFNDLYWALNSEMGTDRSRQLPDDAAQPESLFTALGALDRAGVSIFPIVLRPVPHGVGAQSSISGFNRSAAESVANHTGGVTEIAGAIPGQALSGLLDASRRGFVFRINATVTSVKWFNGLPHVLNIATRDGKFAIRRPLLVERDTFEAEVSTPLDAFQLRVPSNVLRVSAGCPGRNSGDWISLRLPMSISSQSEGKLHMLLDFPGGLRRRAEWNWAKPEGEAICLEVPIVDNGTEFRLVAFDERSDWVGAINARIAR